MKNFKLKLNSLLIMVLSVSLLTSCSIQKRHYNKGFNVDWHHASIGLSKKKMKQSFDKSKSDTLMDCYSSNYNEVDIKDVSSINDFTASSDSTYFNKSNYSDEKSVVTRNPIVLKGDIYKNNQTESINKKDDCKKENTTNREDEKPINGWALTSFILSILSLFATFYGAMALIILSMIFLLIANQQFKKYPNKYRGQKLMNWALIISNVSLVLWTLVFLLL